MKNYLRYLYALLAIPVAIFLRFILLPLIGHGIPYIMLFPVTVCVALLAGLGPAILTGFLGSIVTDYFFIQPLHTITIDIAHFTRMAVVVLTSAFVGYVGDALRAARAKADKQALALRESQKDLNRAQAVANTGSWRLDIRKNELSWSDEAYRIFGIPKDTPLTYESFLAFIHPDDCQFVDAKWKAALTGEKYDIEHRIVVNGQIKWVREMAELEFEKNGSLLGGFGTVTDITERKRAEESLRQAHDQLEIRVQERTKELNIEIAERKKAEESAVAERQRLYNVLETLPVYVVLLTEDYHVPFANRTFEERFGKSNGRRCYEYLFGRNEPCETCETYTVIKTNKPYHWEWTGPDGRNYDVFDFPFIDVDGSKLIMEMGIDITELKMSQQRQTITNSLLEMFARKTSRKEYLDSTVNVISNWSECELVGIRIKDNNGNIPYESCVGFDEEFLTLENPLHLERDSCVCIRTMLQKSLASEYGCITDAGSFYCNDSKAFLAGLTEEQKKNYRGNCIKWGFSSIAVIPIRYRHEVIGAIHITDFKKDMVTLSKIEFIESIISPLIGEAVQRFNAETELEKYRLHLEDMVKQQTDELVRSNKELEQFAYVASHDLQEPLRMIAGYTQLLQQRYKNKLDENANQFIYYTVDGVVRMQSLINDLLAYSRLNTGSQVLEPVDCSAVLDEVLVTLQMTIEENGAAIKYEAMPNILADRTQLLQLFQNLIGNAIKFRSDKSPLINITAKPQGKQWLFSVSDNGIGMEPRYLERIFVIFQRLHTRDKYPGTGIGLAICRKIVERHGGRIWAESQPGKGSIFYFII